MVTLTIDRTTRDVLRELIEWDAVDFEAFEHAIKEGEAVQGRELQAKLALILGLLDEVGWKDEDNRDGYEISADPDALVAWLLAKRRDWELFIIDDTASLRHQEAGHADYYLDGMSQAQSVTDSRERIGATTASVAVVNTLLERLEPAEAVA